MLKKLTINSIPSQRSPLENVKTLSILKNENTPNDPNQDLYHYSDDESKRKLRNNFFKVPKYKDRKSIFSSDKTKLEANLNIKTIRSRFSEYANRALSTSLKTIEAKPKELLFIPQKKKLSQIDRIKKNIENEFRTRRALYLDKMHDVKEANDDREESQDESEEKSKDYEGISHINEPDFEILNNRRNHSKKKEDKILFFGDEQIFPFINESHLEKQTKNRKISLENNLNDEQPKENSLKDKLPLLGIFCLDRVKEKNMISEFKDSESPFNFSCKDKPLSGSNSSLENKIFEKSAINQEFLEDTKNGKEDFSIRTDSDFSGDEYSPTEKQNPSPMTEKKNFSNNNTKNSFKYAKNLQRKSMSIVGFLAKVQRDSFSISKKDMNDMGINLEILRLGKIIKINKNRVNYADVLKGLMEVFIRNANFCDSTSLRSNFLFY